jgi:hypothetical protein
VNFKLSSTYQVGSICGIKKMLLVVKRLTKSREVETLSKNSTNKEGHDCTTKSYFFRCTYAVKYSPKPSNLDIASLVKWTRIDSFFCDLGEDFAVPCKLIKLVLKRLVLVLIEFRKKIM